MWSFACHDGRAVPFDPIEGSQRRDVGGSVTVSKERAGTVSLSRMLEREKRHGVEIPDSRRGR